MLVPPRESNTSAAEAPSRVEQKNTLTVKGAGRNRLAMPIRSVRIPINWTVMNQLVCW